MQSIKTIIGVALFSAVVYLIAAFTGTSDIPSPKDDKAELAAHSEENEMLTQKTSIMYKQWVNDRKETVRLSDSLIMVFKVVPDTIISIKPKL